MDENTKYAIQFSAYVGSLAATSIVGMYLGYLEALFVWLLLPLTGWKEENEEEAEDE